MGGVIGGAYTTYQVLAALSLLGMSLLAASTLAALFSLILRLRRAGAVERQQLKWFLFAAVPAVVCLSVVLLQNMLYNLTSELLYGNTVELLPWKVWNYILYVAMFALLIVPVFTYIAILRYRLYEIDIIINRTLVYGTLTVTLVALYFGGIVVLQRVFILLTGQQSTLAVVASTLLIAAMFTPLRRRIQSFIDRSFYRRKYDAGKTLESFALKLRDETDLDALGDDLLGVVRETMQPATSRCGCDPTRPPRASTQTRSHSPKYL
jgi:MFS family permease